MTKSSKKVTLSSKKVTLPPGFGGVPKPTHLKPEEESLAVSDDQISRRLTEEEARLIYKGIETLKDMAQKKGCPFTSENLLRSLNQRNQTLLAYLNKIATEKDLELIIELLGLRDRLQLFDPETKIVDWRGGLNKQLKRMVSQKREWQWGCNQDGTSVPSFALVFFCFFGIILATTNLL